LSAKPFSCLLREREGLISQPFSSVLEIGKGSSLINHFPLLSQGGRVHLLSDKPFSSLLREREK
jgi:hypothetical protein